MRRSQVAGLLVSVFAATLLSANPKPPLSVVISPLSQTVKSGADVRLNVTLTNTSEHELNFSDRNPVCDYPIKIRDPGGSQPQETAAKQQSRCDGTVQLILGRNILIILKPGESFSEEITVSFLYDLRRTGTYTVQVYRHLPAEISKQDIPSNSATFVVAE